jgi:uncharacterized membrane protein YraQ (UPF0718 family)
MSLVINLVLWGIVAALALTAAVRGKVVLADGLRSGLTDFVYLLPRLVIGVVGAGYLAEVLPRQLIAEWLGPGSGFVGMTLGSLAGALTPGGPVVGFAVGVSALKSGAGAPQVIAYMIAWALFALHRLVLYELPSMPRRVVLLRAAVSVPLPFLAATAALLIGKP